MGGTVDPSIDRELNKVVVEERVETYIEQLIKFCARRGDNYELGDIVMLEDLGKLLRELAQTHGLDMTKVETGGIDATILFFNIKEGEPYE